MSVKEIVEMLREKGHSVEYYIRLDGGILIRSIDGIKYQGAKGNQRARDMVGASLSIKRKSQLSRITNKRKISSTKIQTKLAKVQRKWAKAFGNKKEREAKGKASPGSITSSHVKWMLENKGEKETLEELERKEKYAEGIAYSENVENLADEIDTLADGLEDYFNVDALRDIAEEIRNLVDSFKEEWISKVLEQLYEIEKVFSVGMLNQNNLNEFVRRIKLIISK